MAEWQRGVKNCRNGGDVIVYGCPFHINVNENHLRKMSSKVNLGAHFVWHIFQLDSIALLGSLSTISN